MRPINGFARFVALLPLLTLGTASAATSFRTAMPVQQEETIYADGKSAALGPQAPNPAASANGFSCQFTMAPGSSPAGSYLGLSVFGVPPVAGVGDDSVTNFNVPAFWFAGLRYTRIGFSSNGYAILGGADAASDNTRFNQAFPNPFAPNGVLAPFWTDLNPAAAGALRIATLTDGSDTWIVLDWDTVPEFSSGLTVTAEAWIGIDGDAHPAEDISVVYSTVQGSGDGGMLTVGFEDPNGVHGQNVFLDGLGVLPTSGTQLRITTCDRLFAASFDSK